MPTMSQVENGLVDPTQQLRQRVLQQQAGLIDPTIASVDPSALASPTAATAPTPSAPFQSTSTASSTSAAPSDYYSAANAYLGQGYTGAQAYGMAAKQFPTSAPASAVTYSQSPDFAKASALPKGQSVTAPATTTAPTIPDPTKDLAGWVTATLKAQGSTDDPNYWIQKIQQSGGYSPYWADRIKYAGNAQFPGGQPLPGATGGGAPAASTTGTATAAAPANPFTDQLRALLLQRITNDLQPVDENAPQIADPMTAARDEAARQATQERTALAERLYAQGDGLNTGALTQQIQQSAEQNAGALATLRGNLVAQEYAQRRSDLSDALQLAVASGDSESARAIQLAIANLDATVQREGIGANLAMNAANQNTATVNAGAGA